MNLEKKMGWVIIGAIILLLLAACTPAAAPTPTPVKAPPAAPTAAPPAATPTQVAPAATPVPTKPAATPTVVVVATPAPTVPAATPTAVVAAPTPAPTKPAAGAGDPVAGKSVFDSNCTACHPGGQQGAGPSLVGAVGRMGEARLTSQIRNGGGIMPAFPVSSISDKQLADLIAFLGTLK